MTLVSSLCAPSAQGPAHPLGIPTVCSVQHCAVPVRLGETNERLGPREFLRSNQKNMIHVVWPLQPNVRLFSIQESYSIYIGQHVYAVYRIIG